MASRSTAGLRLEWPAQPRSVVGEPSCLEARSKRVAALSDSACSLRLLCRRLRTSSSRAALSAFS